MAAARGRRARGPVVVAAADLPAFLTRSPVAVLLISLHPVHVFSAPLARQLAADHPGIGLGTVDLRDLLTSRSLHVIQAGGRRCGVPGPFGILPGYCLFRDGTMLAWDAGVPIVSDLAAIAQGTVLGAICSGVTRDASFLRQGIQLAADQATAERVALHFRLALAAAAAPAGAGPAGDEGREPSTGPADALAWAYDRLGVTPDATDAQVHDAWKQLRIAHHPDRVAGDALEFERRSRVSADINRARDVIRTHRSAAGPRGAYARAS
jgi:hypothetical protein